MKATLIVVMAGLVVARCAHADPLERWVLMSESIDAKTGEIVDEPRHVSTSRTFEDFSSCQQAAVEIGAIKVKDGKAVLVWCAPEASA